MNQTLAYDTLAELTRVGVDEFVVCPGARNVPWIQVLVNDPSVKVWWGFEERSSAFFAMGRSRNLQAPVAVVTTSGTAVGELLPACMEAYYTSIPLILLTADRPRRYRFAGTPQTCPQPGLFGHYAPISHDIQAGETLSLQDWDKRSPLHINVSFEEPERNKWVTQPLPKVLFKEQKWAPPMKGLVPFIHGAKRLLTVVSTVREGAQEAVARFLGGVGGDFYLEGVSGLQDRFDSVDPDLSVYTHVLRIGGVPTHRFWRDLEDKPAIKVLSVTEDPFPGITHGQMIHGNLEDLPTLFCKKEKIGATTYPVSGPLHELSKRLPAKSHVYLGNSLPIRMWDQTAIRNPKGLRITASRGLNGIDGQLSTFLGLCRPDQENWAILGDLTTLYDLSALWFLSQMKSMPVTIAILNNGGGRIFEPLFPIPEMINAHSLNFKPLADLWKVDYERWEAIPEKVSSSGQRIVEIV